MGISWYIWSCPLRSRKEQTSQSTGYLISFTSQMSWVTLLPHSLLFQRFIHVQLTFHLTLRTGTSCQLLTLWPGLYKIRPKSNLYFKLNLTLSPSPCPLPLFAIIFPCASARPGFAKEQRQRQKYYLKNNLCMPILQSFIIEHLLFSKRALPSVVYFIQHS